MILYYSIRVPEVHVPKAIQKPRDGVRAWTNLAVILAFLLLAQQLICARPNRTDFERHYFPSPSDTHPNSLIIT